MGSLNLAYFFILLICRSHCLPWDYYDFIDHDDYDSYDGNDVEDDGDIVVPCLDSDAYVYGYPRNESGEALATWSRSSLMNPEEMGGYAEGDILMLPQQSRNGIRDVTFRWEKGQIPYQIEGDFNSEQSELIMKAIADFHRLTCLRFVPYSGQEDYVVIESRKIGCLSVAIGRIGGRQMINLEAPSCVTLKGTVLHELLHVVGFMHEQSRPERDDFVTIRFDNIKPGCEYNFAKAAAKDTNDFGVPYDYDSVMHYSEYAFTKNSEKTIEPRVEGVQVGQREGLSRSDIIKINSMYNCENEEPQSGWQGNVFVSEV